MSQVASQPPLNVYSGFTPDNNFQPLNDCGVGNPFFYHSQADDFSPYRAGDYTSTSTGTGAAAMAQTPGDGGLIAGASGTTAGAVGIQSTDAGFTVNSPPKKVFFEARANLSNVTDAGITLVAGLVQAAAAGVPTDGVYFKYVNTVWTINSAVASVVTSVTLPAAALTEVNAANFDFAFFITRSGDILAYLDTQLVGFVPQSQLTTPNNPQNTGAVSRILAPTLTTANLAPGIWIVQTGANARTLTVDFMGAFKER